jgi:2'-5' RNA ligase
MDSKQSTQKVTALVTTLEGPYGTEIRNLWNWFQAKCGVVNSIASNPIPHFSWQAAESYRSARLDEVTQRLADVTMPLTIRTSGIGLFTGTNLVIYIALVKNKTLADLHARLWEQTYGLATNPNLYYHPDRWMPHITLAMDPLDGESVTCMLKKVVFLSFDWEIPVDHFAVIHAGPPAGLASELMTYLWERTRYQFGR